MMDKGLEMMDKLRIRKMRFLIDEIDQIEEAMKMKKRNSERQDLLNRKISLCFVVHGMVEDMLLHEPLETFSVFLKGEMFLLGWMDHGGISKASVAFGVTRQTLYRWLDGSGIPALHNLVTIACVIARKTGRDVKKIITNMTKTIKRELIEKATNSQKL